MDNELFNKLKDSIEEAGSIKKELDSSKIDDILFEAIGREHAISSMARVIFRALVNTDPGHFIEEMKHKGLNPDTASAWKRAINANILSSNYSIDLLLERIKRVALEEVVKMAAFQHRKGGVDGLEKLSDAPDVERFILQLFKR